MVASRAHGVVVSRLLRMQKALGSNPSGSIISSKKKFFYREYLSGQKCARRESNPGHKHGKLVCYHYTTSASGSKNRSLGTF